MAAGWHFREFKPGDNASDPDFTKALFSRGDERALPHSIVREAIQNSLDARKPKDGTATVRFCVRTGRMSASSSAAQPFLEGAWEHLTAPNAGLSSPPSRRSAIPFLAVEDFGTTGLVGDPAQWQPFGSERNPFFLFFRALGRSGKEGEERGRWGVGKFVFPLASAGSCWFGLTVPHGVTDSSLMGRIVLKTHGSAALSYHPDGHWGLRPASSSLVMPETSQRVIAEFRNVFSLRRRTEPGLSVIVPWLSEDVTGNALMEAAVGEYFLPILRGELVVEIDDNGAEERIDANALRSSAAGIENADVRALVQLGMAITAPANLRLVELPERIRFNAMEWPETGLPEDVAKSLLSILDSGHAIGVRVPIEIKPKDGRPVPTHFDVYLQRADGVGREKPLIVRQGITIPEEKTRTLQDLVSLVIVDHPPLATLVGNAESPAHTELQYQLIKDQFTLAGKLLQLLRTASASIVRDLEHSARDDDPFALAQYFPVLADSDRPKKGMSPKNKQGTGPEPEPEPIEPTQQPVRVSRIEGGFKVCGVNESLPLPDEVSIRFAYDVRRGNPFKRYQVLDFSAEAGDLDVATRDVEILRTEDNRLVVRPIAVGFECAVTGFDPNRNLVVKADAS